MYGLCFEEHPRSETGRLDHSSGNGISTAPVPSQFGPQTEHGGDKRFQPTVFAQRSASMDIASGRRHESNPRFASYGRRSVGQLSNDREGLEGSKRNRDSVSSRNDYNINIDGRQRMDTAVPEPQRDSTRQRRLASSDTTAAGQTVTSTYTSTYKSKTGAAFTGSAPGDPAKARSTQREGSLTVCRRALWGMWKRSGPRQGRYGCPENNK